MRLYLFPAMGTDHRLYSRLELSTVDVQLITWENPEKESYGMAEYAAQMAKHIDISEPFAIGGTSFGGMIAIELAKILNPVKTVLISSAKMHNELPGHIGFYGHIPFHQHIGDDFFMKLGEHADAVMGIWNPDDKHLFHDMMRSVGSHWIKWSIDAVLNWRNKTVPDNVRHFHGNKDLVIPIRNIADPITIYGGTHYMVMNQAAEISQLIDKEFQA